MAIVAKPITLSAGGTVTHTDHNTLYDTIYNEFNGNIDDANIKAGANISGSKLLNASITGGKLAAALILDTHLNYTSVLIVRAGPTIAGANGVRLARGGTAFSLTAGSHAITITFSTADDGNPNFSAIPRLLLSVQTTGGNSYTAHITAINSTQASVTVLSSSGADTATGTVHWLAMGAA